MGWLSPEEWGAVRLSLEVALRSVTMGLPPAVLVAWLLARGRFPGRPLLDALVHLPLVMPPVVVGWLLLVVFGVRGPLGSLLNDWFGVRLVFTTEGASLATAVMAFPLIVRAVRLSLEGVDPGLEAAARTLGAGPLDRFATVTLPLMTPGILAGAITAFAAGLGEFGAVITFASNIPGETQTLPLAIYAATQTPGGEAAAARLALGWTPDRRAIGRRGLQQEKTMKLSARNVLAGKVLDVKKGATTAHVRLELPGGAAITASITNDAVDELGLKAGDQAYAVVKASDVMVGKD